MNGTSAHKTIVKTYVSQFASGHQERALSHLTADVSFEFVGWAKTRGKDELEAALQKFSAGSDGSKYPRTIDRLIEEGNTVVAIGSGSNPVAGGPLEMVFCDVFTFSGDAITRVETYQIPIKVPKPLLYFAYVLASLTARMPGSRKPR
jgi:ketosteroid isomerase-like protein